MAHANFYCCAVCDRVAGFNNSGAEAKAEVCPACANSFGLQGIAVDSVRTLLAWLDLVNSVDAARVLEGLNYKPCFYPNEVDVRVAAVLANISAGEREC